MSHYFIIILLRFFNLNDKNSPFFVGLLTLTKGFKSVFPILLFSPNMMSMKNCDIKCKATFMKGNILFFILFLCVNSRTFCQLQTYTSGEVKGYNGVPTLFFDNKPYPPFAYMSYLGEMKYYKEVAAAGIHLYNFPSYLGDRGINTESGIGVFRPSIWIGENKYDFSSVIKDFEKIIQVDSQAKVIIRLDLDPPQWWEKLNPGSSCQLPDGSTFRQCFFSDAWRKETGKVLQDCIKWLLNSPYAKYFVGIHIAAGGTEEWVYHSHQYFYDENPARVLAFRQWLKQKYKNNTHLLQKAWHNKNVTFFTANLADISGKELKDKWRDPEVDQNFIDTYRFHAETLVDDIAYFSKIVKETSNRRLLTGAFYGYHYFLTDPRKGHGALNKLLTCPDLDYLSSPNDYNRVIGEDWPAMAAIQSVQKHGKLWLAENDTRTSITTLLKDQAPEINPPGSKYESGVWLGPKDMETSVAFLWKEFGPNARAGLWRLVVRYVGWLV